MSEQPSVPNAQYDRLADTARFANDDVINLHMANPTHRTAAEVIAEREARQAVEKAYGLTSALEATAEPEWGSMEHVNNCLSNLDLVRTAAMHPEDARNRQSLSEAA